MVSSITLETGLIHQEGLPTRQEDHRGNPASLPISSTAHSQGTGGKKRGSALSKTGMPPDTRSSLQQRDPSSNPFSVKKHTWALFGAPWKEARWNVTREGTSCGYSHREENTTLCTWEEALCILEHGHEKWVPGLGDPG